ncbi:hypothetical protein [Streptomyces sp. NPDC002619]|uniref:hypothetical protein n=1 Tax=Streptomyces sp. NPDC002619 TaxID=3364655 RepID=UPI00368B8F4B
MPDGDVLLLLDEEGRVAQPDELLARLSDTTARLVAARAAVPPLDPLARDPLTAGCTIAIYDPVDLTCIIARAGLPEPVAIFPDGTSSTLPVAHQLPYEAPGAVLPPGAVEPPSHLVPVPPPARVTPVRGVLQRPQATPGHRERLTPLHPSQSQSTTLIRSLTSTYAGPPDSAASSTSTNMRPEQGG